MTKNDDLNRTRKPDLLPPDAKIVRLTDETFLAAINTPQAVLVVFTAPERCPPCRDFMPVLEQLVKETPVYLVDIEQADTADLTKKLELYTGARFSVPMLRVYECGMSLFQHIGKLDLEPLRAFVKDGRVPPPAPPVVPRLPQGTPAMWRGKTPLPTPPPPPAPALPAPPEPATTTKVYTFDFESASVVERTCEVAELHKGAWPGKDSSGATMYDNTHYDTPEKARAKLRREVEASLEMGARERDRLRQALVRVTEELANDAERLVKIAGDEAQALVDALSGVLRAR